jgi:hypothetical protein
VLWQHGGSLQRCHGFTEFFCLQFHSASLCSLYISGKAPIRGKASPRIEIHRKATVATPRTRRERGGDGDTMGDGLRRRARDRGGGGSKQHAWIRERGGAGPLPERARDREWNPSPVLPCYLYSCVLWARP